MTGQHRAGRFERSWLNTHGAHDGEPAGHPGGGYGHAQRLAAMTEPWEDRHRHESPAGLPYRLPVDTAPFPIPDPVHVPPVEPEPEPEQRPATGWTVWEFATFLSRRHPDTGTGWCGCGEQARGCPIRYGLSMIDWGPQLR